MLTRVSISNYRSFVHAEADLSPFTLVIGANGSGKTNFLKFFRDANTIASGFGFRPPDGGHPHKPTNLMPHLNGLDEPTFFSIKRGDLDAIDHSPAQTAEALFPGQLVEIFRIEPDRVTTEEVVGNQTVIESSGAGVINALDALKTGIREDLFDAIQTALAQFIPEIEKLGFKASGNSRKSLEVQHQGLKVPTPGHLLSEGTRTLLALLTIIHQITPPPLLLIEDLDHSLHPRLFEGFVEYLRDVCRERRIQVIATTHNPYLLDCFSENYDAVLIAKKIDGASTLSNFGEELRVYYSKDPGAEIAPLSDLYLRGYVGASDSPSL
jgi:energy-coupling factor transporter ATP-binding protein EcfA2